MRWMPKPANNTPATPSTHFAARFAEANGLRNVIDQADFKAYIFPLMFFKRISDVYLEEYAQALDESGGDHEFALFAENHRFAIPHGCHWEDIRGITQNIGAALLHAMRSIEKANPDTLPGVFGDVSFSSTPSGQAAPSSIHRATSVHRNALPA